MASKQFEGHIYKVTSKKRILHLLILLITLVVTVTIFGKLFLNLSGKMVILYNYMIIIVV